MKQVQVIKCKCGKVFAMCLAPECYQDAEWMRDIRKYSKKGCTVEIGDSSNFKFEDCTCEKKEEPTLF